MTVTVFTLCFNCYQGANPEFWSSLETVECIRLHYSELNEPNKLANGIRFAIYFVN